MEQVDRIYKAQKFFQDNKEQIGISEVEGLNYITVDFHDVLNYDMDLADELLDEFEQCIADFEFSLKQLDLDREYKVRFKNLPKSTRKQIWSLRVDDVNKLITVAGYVRKVSTVNHSIKSTNFECQVCTATRSILQESEKYYKPKKCNSCNSLNSYKETSRVSYDTQKIVVEDDPNEVPLGLDPRRILVVLTDSLCEKHIDEKLQPSKRVLLTGVVKEKPLNKEGLEFTKYILVNNLELLDDEKVNLTKSDIAEFKELAVKENFLEDLAQSVFPTIYGHDHVKLAVLLLLVGGTNIYRNGKLEERGTINILLIGSPGSGKSMALKRAIQFVPRSRFTGGKGTSAAGLIAAVVRDEELGGYSLEPGAVPLCHTGICAIDELDKITKEDQTALNNAMTDLQVSIDRASIHATLQCDTSILAAANPTNRIFDRQEAIWRQLGLPKDLLDRFDLIFPMESVETEEEQKMIAKTIMSKYRGTLQTKPKYEMDFVKKFIAYARNEITPEITEEAEEVIIENFLNLVKPDPNETQAVFSNRLLPNLIRLATAVAKLRLSKKVDSEDALKAVEIAIESYKRQDLIKSDGLINIEKLEAIPSKQKRMNQKTKVGLILGIIIDLQKKSEDGFGDLKDILEKTAQADIDPYEVNSIIEKLREQGDIFEPRPSKYKYVGIS